MNTSDEKYTKQNVFYFSVNLQFYDLLNPALLKGTWSTFYYLIKMNIKIENRKRCFINNGNFRNIVLVLQWKLHPEPGK
jgi:hypothetical protein